MADGKSRLSEAEVNNTLGRMLREKNLRWHDCIETEQTGVIRDAVGKRPDIIVNHPGSLPVIIESEFEPARTVEEDAKSRLGSVLLKDGRRIEQVIALKIPSEIVTVEQQHLDAALSTAIFQYALLVVSGLEQTRWPEKGYVEGGIDDFVTFVEHTALSESIMSKGLEVLQNCISVAANIVQRDNHPAVSTHKKLAVLLNQEQGEQTTRMAMAILANAVSFHNTISNIHDVLPLSSLTNMQGIYNQSMIADEWQRIYTEINYWPILFIARKILNTLRPTIASRVFSSLAQAARQLEGIGATSQHDLSGRMLQSLIADRKFLATYYTLPNSATLLAELAISRLKVDWSKPEEITKLQIGDFACGTGALLNAAYRSVLMRYRRTGGDDSKLHAPMIEKTLVGTDIMPAATHLTASILSSAHPAEPFLNTKIITLPYGINSNAGGDTIDIGALDLIKEENVFSLFQTSQDRVKGSANGDSDNVHIPHKSFDLVIMNPPFTRPTNHEGDHRDIPNPAFAGFETSPEAQEKMADKLKKGRDKQMAGHGNAGLASNFVDIAQSKIKEGGMLALVIPYSFVSGASWGNARKMLERYYQDIMVVSISNSKITENAFSADTAIAEVLLIAQRTLEPNETPPKVTYVNLAQRLGSILEAGIATQVISKIPNSNVFGRLGYSTEDISFGNFLRSTSGFENYAGIADVDVARTASALSNGNLLLPRQNEVKAFKSVQLKELGLRGVVHRDIDSPAESTNGIPRGPFYRSEINSPMQSIPYPFLWSHDCEKETRLVVTPDFQGIPRDNQEDRAQLLWNKYASRLCFSSNFRFTSQPLAACFTSVKAIGGAAWPGFRCHDERHDVPILLFANSTLGLISYWWNGSRQQNGRSIQTVSKMPQMMTIDPRQFTEEQFKVADLIFDKFKTQDLLPANEAFCDPVRISLDKAVLVDLLGFAEDVMESMDILRHNWCNEPSVHGGKSTKPGGR